MDHHHELRKDVLINQVRQNYGKRSSLKVVWKIAINTNVDLVLKTGSEFEICGEPERPDDRRRKIKKLKSSGFVLFFLKN